MTSTQAVAAVRRIFDAQKAGHAGTLDPMATGILAIALGEATKTVPYVQDARRNIASPPAGAKRATATMPKARSPARPPSAPAREAIEAMLPRFTGTLTQVPPAYSAIKVGGERAYDLARDGETVTLEPRTVEVVEARLLGIPDTDHAEFEIHCGKGTYVRSWVRDMALALGTVGHVSALRRTRIGGVAGKRRGRAGNPDPFYA